MLLRVMSVTVKYFASLREHVGRSEEVAQLGRDVTAAQLWQQLTRLPLPAHALVAGNLRHATPQTPISDGDEVAFFPPVTGG